MTAQVSRSRFVFPLSPWVRCCMAVAVVLVFIAGCGESGKETTGGTENAAGETASTDAAEPETIRLAFVTNQIANFWNIAEVGANDAGNDLSKDGSEIEVEVRFPDPGQAAVQKQIVEDLIAAQQLPQWSELTEGEQQLILKRLSDIQDADSEE